MSRIKTILYFTPEVFPDIEEIKDPTTAAFYSAATNKIKLIGGFKYLKLDTSMPFEEIDIDIIREFCKNNNAEAAIIPKVKYFKVGFGKYVFSNQVIVSLKLYNANGDYIMETAYDTYKANGRMLGSAENSVILGTEGALEKMTKELKNREKQLRKAS